MASTQHPGAVAAGARTAPDGLARLALKLDGAVTGLNGLGYLVLAGALDSLLGIGTVLLYPVGAFLLIYAAGVLVAGTRASISRKALAAVLTANVAWAVLSLVTLVSGVLTPTLTGGVWTVMQAAAVGGFAALQYAGLRRM